MVKRYLFIAWLKLVDTQYSFIKIFIRSGSGKIIKGFIGYPYDMLLNKRSTFCSTGLGML